MAEHSIIRIWYPTSYVKYHILYIIYMLHIIATFMDQKLWFDSKRSCLNMIISPTSSFRSNVCLYYIYFKGNLWKIWSFVLQHLEFDYRSHERIYIEYQSCVLDTSSSDSKLIFHSLKLHAYNWYHLLSIESFES